MAPRWIAVAGLVYHLISGASVLSPLDNTSQTLTDGWHAWRVPAVREAQSRCCYGSHGSSDTTAGCHLDGRSGGFTTRANADVESDETKILAQIAAGRVKQVRAFSSRCPVQADTPIHDLGLIDGGKSVSWLAALATPRGPISSDAIAAISAHDVGSADTVLLQLARSDQALENRKDAVFWMALTRPGMAPEVKKIMFKDTSAVLREHAAFALSQSTADDRADALVELAHSDASAQVRAQAWFWLAQTGAAQAERELLDAISNDPSPQVREQAVFALSQLPAPRSVKALIDLLEATKLETRFA